MLIERESRKEMCSCIFILFATAFNIVSGYGVIGVDDPLISQTDIERDIDRLSNGE